MGLLMAFCLRFQQFFGDIAGDKFIGALTRQRLRKGVFLTTSDLSVEARDAAAGLDMKVVLIDGRELAQLMIENNLGVNVKEIYEVKQVDTDYFIEE
ncbi:MAG: restriction endonuclease [Pseudomonadota bacterium]|nr:restriction endonuclease [Pseudomonadota bacterium]